MTTPIGEGFAGKIAHTGEPAILPDLRASDADDLDPLLQGTRQSAVGRSAALEGAPSSACC